MSALKGKRILIVDDEALVALFAEDMLLALDAIPVGPAGSVQEAAELIEHGGFDAAILDVNLNGATSEQLARRLAKDGVPFVVVTGYGRVDWSGLNAPVLAKPYDASAISAALERALGSRLNSGPPGKSCGETDG